MSKAELIARWPTYGPSGVVLVKIVLATLLINHTGEIGINSSYYPIYYVPIVTCGAPLRRMGHAVVDLSGFGGLLRLSLSGAAGIRTYSARSGSACDPNIVLLSRGHGGESLHPRKSPADRQNQQVAEQLTKTNRELERAQAEARRSERLAALGHLSAGLAHEIRNPLGVIKGSAEMLHQKLEDSNPLASELAGYISSEVNRASALVTRFLDFARPLRTETRLLQVTELLDQALNSVAAQWKGGNCRW